MPTGSLCFALNSSTLVSVASDLTGQPITLSLYPSTRDDRSSRFAGCRIRPELIFMKAILTQDGLGT